MLDDEKSSICSREVELCIIGCLSSWYEELKDRISAISDDDFFYSDTAELFNTIKALHNDNLIQGIDISIIGSRAGHSLVKTLIVAASRVSTAVMFDTYLLELKEIAISRRLNKEAARLVSSSERLTAAEFKNIAEAEGENTMVIDYKARSKQCITDYFDSLSKPKDRIMMGFKTLDGVTGGLRVPSVMMIGAYPSVGKTAFALNIAINQDGPVLFFSLEMSNEMIYDRLMSSICSIDYNLFNKQKLDEQHLEQITGTQERFGPDGFMTFDDVYDVEGHAAIIAATKPRLVIIDYVQKVQTRQRTDSRRAEIDYISGVYKQTAKSAGCAIILLSQLTREGRGEPKMSNLKESGALEADGDYVGILHRPYVLEKDNPEISQHSAYILIDKNKFGNTGKLELYFDGKYQRFYEIECENSQQKLKDISEPIKVKQEEIPFS